MVSNMKVNGRGDLVYTLFIVFTLIAQCTGRSYPSTTGIANGTAAMNSSLTLNESKFKITFCFVPPYCFDGPCYCCTSVKPQKCYDKNEDCQANCLSCNPRCPAQVTVEG
ncbi:unnamed protein product [Urochloa humidicola]